MRAIITFVRLLELWFGRKVRHVDCRMGPRRLERGSRLQQLGQRQPGKEVKYLDSNASEEKEVDEGEKGISACHENIHINIQPRQVARLRQALDQRHALPRRRQRVSIPVEVAWVQ